MTRRAGIAIVLAAVCGWAAGVLGQETPITPPQPTVPEVFTMQGQYVRVAYNNEGFVTLGYRVANQSVGEEWIVLEIGATVRAGQPPYVLKRDALSLETPDGKSVPLPSNQAFKEADLRSLTRRSSMTPDSVNYFPPGASRPCRIGFFAETGSSAEAWDQVELNDQSGCLGRLYFQVPGGLQYGQHWLNVRFAKSLVRVPFRILTKEEEKTFSKSWQDIKKELDESFKK